MKRDVVKALYAQGFSALARAYRTSYGKLGGINIETIDISSLDGEQSGLVDIVNGVEFLALYLDGVTHTQKQLLDESARRLLDSFSGVPRDPHDTRFDPDFELVSLLRFIALTQDAMAA